MADKPLSDGTFSFYGGMDLSRSAYAIDKDQYAKGVNVAVTKVGDNLQPRPGWHWQKLRFGSPFEQNLFETGNVQGGGWYFDGAFNTLIISIAGVLFHLQQKMPGEWLVRALNLGNRNNPTRTKVWTCRIPGNRFILSDGQALPYVFGLDGSYIRPDPAEGQMGVCRMMTYVQNRLWWVDEFGTIVNGSDLADPLSVLEAIDTNLFGFVPPDDREVITAVGQQRYINFDQNGGELVFSTDKNVYAVNVPARVPREEWGLNQNVGSVRLVVPFVGATSAYSFTNYNTNLFYRTSNLGVANYKQLQTQFANNDEMISNSIEVDYWYDADTPWMLDQCYTVNYKGRLLTTTSPTLANGYCYWRGLIAFNPAPYYGSKNRLPRRFEGLWTGVQPWCLIHQEGTIEQLFTVSRDGDGRTRLYVLVDDKQYDVAPGGVRREIESFIETRSYTCGSPEFMKVFMNRYYTLDKLTSDVHIDFFSRSTLLGTWFPFQSITHFVAKCCRTEEICFPWNSANPESRRETYLPDERETGCENPFEQGGPTVPYRAYRFQFKGAYQLSSIGIYAKTEAENTTVTCCEEDNRFALAPTCPLKDFAYFIVEPNLVSPLLSNARISPDTTGRSQSKCGC